MKRRVPVGLVVEGSSSGSALFQLPGLLEQLGPIKSTSLRVARRFSNFFRAGYAVGTYEDLQDAKLILIHVPDSAAARIVSELSVSQIPMKGCAFVLCESWLTSDSLKPLSDLGSAVGTLVNIPSVHRKWFVIEGSATAIRHTRRFLEESGARALPLRNGTKGLYLAAQLLAAALPISLFAAAQFALREAGISGNHLHALLEEMSQKMFRNFSNGAKIDSATSISMSPVITQTHMAAVRRDYPQLAQFLDRQVAQTRQSFSIKRSH